MRLDPKALAYAVAALWGGGVLAIGLANLSSSSYGQPFLKLLDALYPGYAASPSVENVLIGTGYALLHGAVTGWAFGWLYNRLVKL